MRVKGSGVTFFVLTVMKLWIPQCPVTWHSLLTIFARWVW